MIKLKICGMKFSENIAAVTELQPDYLGFIFFAASPRNFSGSIGKLPEGIKKTGVFVNATAKEVLEKIENHQLETVQLHGEESPEYCRELKELIREQFRSFSVEIVKVFSIRETFELQNLIPYEEWVDFFLFDTWGKARGGNGIRFNWDLLLDYPSQVPFFLSGGIGLEEAESIKNLAAHFRKLGKEHLFYGIDVNSRFEEEPGRKNIKKLIQFKERLGGIAHHSSKNSQN